MTATLRTIRHRVYDSTDGYDEHMLIAHPYRPADDAPYVTRGVPPVIERRLQLLLSPRMPCGRRRSAA